MIKYTNEELLEALPTNVRETKDLTTKQKVVLGQLIIYNGLDKKKDGYFFRSNKDLCEDCNIQEKTLIAAVNQLVMLGFIERKSGSRKKASLYRINLKTINDYCKTNVDDNCKKENENYSDDYSKIITAMHVRITELELTVKTLIKRITVIEGRNYSTDKDIDIELDKEKDILNNNILNNNSFNNILEETENRKELETNQGEEKKVNQSQLESNEIPSEVLVSTIELDGIEEQTNTDEETFVPTTEDKEILKLCNQIINPYLIQVQRASSIQELNSINAKLVQALTEKKNHFKNISESAARYVDERIDSYFTSRAKQIEEMHQEQITKQLNCYNQYASNYC